MFLFYLKKNFCDGWDNMMSLLLPNILIVLIAVATFFSTHFLITTMPTLAITIQIVGVFLIFFAIFAFGKSAAQIANFKTPTFKSYLSQFIDLKVWKDCILFALLNVLFIVVGVVGIPFYLRQSEIGGIFLAALLFWFLLIVLLSLQWFIPIRVLLKNNFLKSLKKCFIIFFDNPIFSILVFLYTILLSVLSVLLFFMLPGFTGVLLAPVNALKLRLYKYDWLEEHPELTPQERKHIPWYELIADDNETIGPRTFKSFFLPWKE